jgi:hypothetical protein
MAKFYKWYSEFLWQGGSNHTSLSFLGLPSADKPSFKAAKTRSDRFCCQKALCNKLFDFLHDDCSTQDRHRELKLVLLNLLFMRIFNISFKEVQYMYHVKEWHINANGPTSFSAAWGWAWGGGVGDVGYVCQKSTTSCNPNMGHTLTLFLHIHLKKETKGDS